MAQPRTPAYRRAADAAGRVAVNTVAPAITGTAQHGETLTLSDGTWTGSPTLSKKWLRNGAPIAGQIGGTYVLAAGDVGATIRGSVRGTKEGTVVTKTAAATAAVIAAVAPANTVLPAITGTAQEGATLTTTDGTWTGAPTPTYARQWKRDAVAISGATATTYVLVTADVGAVITCTVTATNVGGAVSATSAGTAAVIAA